MQEIMVRYGRAGKEKIELLPVVKDNPKTVWVRLPDGHIIKRHKVKHGHRRD